MRRPITVAGGLIALAASVVASPALAGDVPGPLAPNGTLLGRFQDPAGVRVATFNVSLNRFNQGDLLADLAGGQNPQARAVAEIIQRSRPDVLLLNEFDEDLSGRTLQVFLDEYLAVSQNGATPIVYEHRFVAGSNTGVPSGFDLNNDGSVGGPDDAFGFGFFPGQFAMAVVSRFPIIEKDIRTFQQFLWKDMPGALLPDDPSTPEPADWFSPEELEVVRLSSKSHWDVPVQLPGGTVVHLLASHPTPPVFDGPEDRNGRRNRDEIRFWADYVTPGAGGYIRDDAGVTGGLAEGASFVIAGDKNADPFDGDDTDEAILQLLTAGRVNAAFTPGALGGIDAAAAQGGANDAHAGDPSHDTADFNDNPAPCNLRADYVLPSADLPIGNAGVFWPRTGEFLHPLVGPGFPIVSSDHRLVYVDLALPGSTMPNGVAAGDVTSDSVVLWANSTIAGDVVFEVSTDPSFGSIERTEVAAGGDETLPAKVMVAGLTSGTTYHYRATDLAGTVVTGTFRTAVDTDAALAPSGFRMGITGDWRGELAPYPAINNMAGSDLDLVIGLGDTIYADVESPILPGIQQVTTPEEYALKHLEVYRGRFGIANWADVRSSTTLLVTIDDHEVTNDFSGGAHPSSDPRFAGDPAELINDAALYEAGMGAFQAFNPVQDEFYGDTGDARTDGERKLYRYHTYGTDAAVMVLDNRSFRDEPLPAVTDPTDLAQVIAFLTASFDPSRTMLGQPQLQDLLADLADAQARGVVWKFVIVPEPIQNLGVAAASDRFEGYAAERTAILDFITTNGIENVVFVAADIHGTLVNNLKYELGPLQPQLPTSAWEITTGSVAYDAPFGPTVVQLAAALGILTPEQVAFYESLPLPGKEAFLRTLVDGQLTPLGYDTVGLEGSSVPALLLEGSYTATHTYGWTEFDIAPETGVLTVTTWGIEPYSTEELLADPACVVSRQPAVVSKFLVQPAGACLGDSNGDGQVDFADLVDLLAAWGTDSAIHDLDGDGQVSAGDLLILLAAYGAC